MLIAWIANAAPSFRIGDPCVRRLTIHLHEAITVTMDFVPESADSHHDELSGICGLKRRVYAFSAHLYARTLHAPCSGFVQTISVPTFLCYAAEARFVVQAHSRVCSIVRRCPEVWYRELQLVVC